MNPPKNYPHNLLFSLLQNSLKGYITHGGYKAEPMILGETRILGVQSAVTSVQVNGASYSQFTYKDQVSFWLILLILFVRLSITVINLL